MFQNFVEVGVISARSPSSKNTKSSAKSVKANWSEAIKFSPTPWPTTSGLPFLAAAIIEGSLE